MARMSEKEVVKGIYNFLNDECKKRKLTIKQICEKSGITDKTYHKARYKAKKYTISQIIALCKMLGYTLAEVIEIVEDKEIHCSCTDEEITKSFIDDVGKVEKFLKENRDKLLEKSVKIENLPPDDEWLNDSSWDKVYAKGDKGDKR